MTAGELKEKGIKRARTIIYGRTVFVILAMLIQFAMLIAVYFHLRDYSLTVYGVFVFLGLLVVLHLYNGRENPDLKLVWMLPILVFPIFGALLYLYISMQPGTRIIKRRLERITDETKAYVPQNQSVKERLDAENVQMGHFAEYMNRYANCTV